jgi:STE24 endopeptidase
VSPALRIAAIGIGAAAWLAAAWTLLPTAVPDDLRLPTVDVDGVFGTEAVARAERFERVPLVLWPLGQAATLAALAAYARWGAAYARESAGGRIATGMLLGMLGLGLAWLAALPFGIVSFWWDRRHGLDRTGWASFLVGDYLALGGSFLAVCVALLVSMSLAGRLGERWWLPGSLAIVGIVAAVTLLAPYLASELRPLEPSLRRAAEAFEREQGVDGISYGVEDVGDTTPLANAYAAGFGPTKRVVLWDTLLDGRFDDRAVRVVLAHEIAHHSSDHLREGIAWFALFAVPGAWILARATRRRGGLARPEAVPLALLVVALLQLAAAPATNWLSRRSEAEADWKALGSTADPAGARRLFVGFAADGLGDPDPPGWSQVVLGSHPTLADRVAMAEAWARREGER